MEKEPFEAERKKIASWRLAVIISVIVFMIYLILASPCILSFMTLTVRNKEHRLITLGLIFMSIIYLISSVALVMFEIK